ncbi:MAG: glycosyltransferase [Bacteroidales bacterium]|nr:glycosyltransferase [Bacteroidales bacterium]
MDTSLAPLVSVCCLTYNHAPFIRNCLDGFLAQKTDFSIEILIHDDASTDGTDRIIREYAEKYPEIIFPIFEEENQYSRGYAGKMDIEFNYSRARGKYIAYCEGDDYWTDPSKLQRQVDFMETHPDYSVCFHRCKRLDSRTGKMYNDDCWHALRQGREGVDITVEMFLKSWITQPLTMVFRRDKFDFSWQKRYHYYRDMHEIYHLLMVGKGYLFAFIGGVYRMHPGGMASLITQEEYCKVSLPMDREFYHRTRHPQARRIYGATLQTCINVYADTNKWKALYYSFLEFAVNCRHKTFGKNIARIINGK